MVSLNGASHESQKCDLLFSFICTVVYLESYFTYSIGLWTYVLLKLQKNCFSFSLHWDRNTVKIQGKTSKIKAISYYLFP